MIAKSRFSISKSSNKKLSLKSKIDSAKKE